MNQVMTTQFQWMKNIFVLFIWLNIFHGFSFLNFLILYCKLFIWNIYCAHLHHYDKELVDLYFLATCISTNKYISILPMKVVWEVISLNIHIR